MDFELEAQYESYTRAELMDILDHKDRYTPEAVAAATAVLNARHPGWNTAKAHEAQLALEERHAAPGPDLLDDLEVEVVQEDRLAPVGYWVVGIYLLVWNALAALFIIRVVFSFGWTSFSNGGFLWGVLVLPVIVTVLWFRKKRWGWNLTYLFLLYTFIQYTSMLHSTSLALPSIAYPVLLAIRLLTYAMTLATPFCLWLAARKRTADLFGVVLENRVFIIIVGWVAALSYLCLTWDDNIG